VFRNKKQKNDIFFNLKNQYIEMSLNLKNMFSSNVRKI
jgi:hypothetical protein